MTAEDLTRLSREALIDLVLCQARENEALKAQVGKLELLVQEVRRAGKRQAGPFSKGEPKAKPQRPGRKAGAAHGPSSFRPVPERVDEVHDASVPCRCPACGGEVEDLRVEAQYQTEVPKVQPVLRRFDVHVGRCRRCGTRVQGRHPLQTSDALGAAASQLGPNALALATYMHVDLGTTFGKLKTFFAIVFGIQVSRGGLALGLHRVARTLEPTYRGLVAEVKHSPVVYPDETSMRISGRLGWLWVFVTQMTTVYVQRMSRGVEVIEEILGLDYAGKVGHDGYAPYDKLTQAIHQQCLAHLLRRAREILQTATGVAARFPFGVKFLLQDAIDLRDRREAGEVSAHGLAVATGHLESRLDVLLASRPTNDENRRFRNHLDNHRDELFTFLREEDLEATSWPADHATRPAVLFRKISGGHRSARGAHTHEVLLSVGRTCWQRAADSLALLIRALCARDPTVLAIEPALPAP